MKFNKLTLFLAFTLLLVFYTYVVIAIYEARGEDWIPQEISSKQLMFLSGVKFITILMLFKVYDLPWKLMKKQKIEYLEVRLRTLKEQQELKNKMPGQTPPSSHNRSGHPIWDMSHDNMPHFETH